MVSPWYAHAAVAQIQQPHRGMEMSTLPNYQLGCLVLFAACAIPVDERFVQSQE